VVGDQNLTIASSYAMAASGEDSNVFEFAINSDVCLELLSVIGHTPETWNI